MLTFSLLALALSVVMILADRVATLESPSTRTRPASPSPTHRAEMLEALTEFDAAYETDIAEEYARATGQAPLTMDDLTNV